MTSIHAFKHQMSGGGARANQFRVTLTFPTFVGGQVAERQIPFMVSAASLPEQTLGIASVPFRGREIKWAGDRTTSPWSVNVYNDTDFEIRSALETWSQGIVENETNRGRTKALQYQTQALVEQLDRNDQVLKQYKFIDLWPVQVGEIQLDYGANDQIEMFPVTFDYLYFLTDNVDGQVGTDGDITS
jgi:hypothetical protein